MPRANTSRSKSKRDNVTRPGGLGGPGGRGGRRWSMRQVDVGSPALDIKHLDARGLAAAVKEAAEREPAARFTPYRRAMSMLTDHANRDSKSMKPEVRKKLADAKRELREMFDRPQTSYGEGGPGKVRHKAKAKSRRTPR